MGCEDEVEREGEGCSELWGKRIEQSLSSDNNYTKRPQQTHAVRQQARNDHSHLDGQQVSYYKVSIATRNQKVVPLPKLPRESFIRSK